MGNYAASLGMDAVGGLLSGAAMGGGSVAISSVANTAAKNKAYKSIGDGILMDGNVEALQTVLKDIAGNKSASRKASAKNIGKLYIKAAETIREQTKADLTAALEKSGVSNKISGEVAATLSKVAMGEPLSERETELASTYLQSEKIFSVYDDVILNPESATGKRLTSFAEVMQKKRMSDTNTENTAPAAQERSSEGLEEATESVGDGDFLKSSGEAVKTLQVAEINGKDVTVTVNGKTNVPLDDVSWADETTALAYDIVTDTGNMTPAAANLILSNPKANNRGFLESAVRVFKAGVRNDMKVAETLDYDVISPDEARALFGEGQKAAEAQVAARDAEVKAKQKTATEDGSAAERKGGVFYEYDGKTIKQRNDGKHKPLTKKQRVAVNFTERLAKKFDSTVFFYESYEENGKRMYNDRDGNVREAKEGFYDPSDGSIHIDLNGDNVLFTVSHELVHFIKDWSPVQFKKMADLVMKGFNRQGLTAEELIEAKQADYAADGITLTEEQAFEEVIAASLEGIMADGRVMELLQAAEAKDKRLGAKLRQFFQDVKDLIRDTIDSYKNAVPGSPEGRLIRKMEDLYSQLQEAFAEGVMDAGTNFQNAENTTGEGGVRFKTSNEKYWYPNMTKSEIAEVKSIAKNEAKKTDNYLGIGAKWLYNKEKGNEFFALYSDIDTEAPTVLYACKDDRATLHNRILMEALKIKEETYERINADAGNLDEVLSSIEDVVSRKHQHSGSVMGTGSDNGNASVHSRNKRIRLDKAFINCLRNIEKVQQQYGLDDHYKFAIDRGDIKTAQRMVLEAAVNAGYAIRGYHGSRTPGFTVVEKYSWLWLARDKSVAKTYGTHADVNNTGKPHSKKGVYDMVYNLGNNLQIEGDGNSWGELPVNTDEYPGVYADEETGDITTNAMAEWAEHNGYDSITFVNVMDGGGSPTTVDVIFNPNRDAKSADPVTYDDDGNVIPLSERFNSEKKDIRYSIGSKTDGAVQKLLERENDALREDVARLKELLKLQGTETHGTRFTASSVEAAARYMKKNAGAKGDTKALSKLLNGFYEHIAKTKELTWEDVREQAKPIANWLMDHVEHNRSDYAQEVLDQIHGSRVYLDESQTAEAAYRFESYDAFRRSMAGAITISRNADMSMDVWWQEMSTLYPDIFSADITASDMPGELFNIVNRLRNENSSALEYEHNRRWIQQDLIRDIYDSYWRVNNLRTVADRNAAQINRLKSLHAQRMNKMKADNRQQIEQLKEQHKAEVKAYRDAYRKNMETQRKELSDKYQESRHKAVEGRRATELRNKIRRFKEKLQSTMQHPTDGKFVPKALFGAMVDVCELIDTDTDLYKSDGSLNKAQRQRELTRDRLRDLRDQYENLKNNPDDLYKGEYDEYVAAYLKELESKCKGKSLSEMSLAELDEMYKILKSIGGVLTAARELIGWNDGNNVHAVADTIVDEQVAVRNKRKDGKRNFIGISNDKVQNFALSPIRNAERMSGYAVDSALVKVMRDLESGVRKKNFFVMESYKMFEDVSTGKQYEDAIYKAFGKTYTDINGRSFGVSKMQMMQAILSYEREQLNANLRHVDTGGFLFADLDLLGKGKVKESISVENAHQVPAAGWLVAEFNEALKNDVWCQIYMTKAREFFNNKAKTAVNEASMAVKHRIVAKDKAYIPFEVNQADVVKEIDAKYDVQQTINSYGMLKDTTNNAQQALIVTGLNNVIERHIEQVGTVYGLSVPVRNFNKVWNARSVTINGRETVKSSIERNWGKEGIANIEQAVQDVQGPRMSKQPAVYRKLRSGYIGATFLLNLSVVSKQIGSLYAANSALYKARDPASMLAHLSYTMVNYKTIAAEVDQYTATAWVRRQGLSDAELSTLMTEGRKTFAGKFISKLPTAINPTKWITGMDSAVSLSLWKYCKEDVAERTGLTGEALLKATAKHFDNVVENTQSMTDVLHRPEIQKSDNMFWESFAMFKTDLYQMAGQLQSVAGRAFANPTKENRLALGRTIYAVASSALWGQLMTAVFAMLRYKVDRYRDEDDELTAQSWLRRQSFGLIGDLTGYVFPLFGSELVGVIEALYYGETDDLLDNMTMSNVNDLYTLVLGIVTKLASGKEVTQQQWRRLAGLSLQMFGIPANNILRLLDAIKKHAKDISEGDYFKFNEK